MQTKELLQQRGKRGGISIRNKKMCLCGSVRYRCALPTWKREVFAMPTTYKLYR